MGTFLASSSVKQKAGVILLERKRKCLQSADLGALGIGGSALPIPLHPLASPWAPAAGHTRTLIQTASQSLTDRSTDHQMAK